MEHSDTTAAAAAVVRQLDFSVTSILPDHPQAQLQAKLLALAHSHHQKLHAPAGSPSQTRLPPSKVVVPPVSPVARRLPKPKLQPLMKMESPKAREKSSLEQKDGTPKKQKQCKCKNSRCLKLYCDCFASGVYCDGCNCFNCHNTLEHEAERQIAVEGILERNPNAFRPKIANSPGGATDGGGEHNKGCNCKRSYCLKRYCECFQANIPCSDKCKCVDCKNYDGSEEKNLLFHEHHVNRTAYIKQVTNAAINGAVGTASKPNTQQQLFTGITARELPSSWVPQLPQETCSTSNVASLPSSVHLPTPAYTGIFEHSKSSYRSALAGILKFQDVEDLCTLLVDVSAEAAKTIISAENRGIDMNKANNAASSSHDDGKDTGNNAATELQEYRETRDGSSSSETQEADNQNGRPLSPGTLALMCDEQYTTYAPADSQNPINKLDTSTSSKSASGDGVNELYIEQERLVLTRFHSFLNRLIDRAGIQGQKPSYS